MNCNECVYKRFEHRGHCFMFKEKPDECKQFVMRAKLREEMLKPRTSPKDILEASHEPGV